MQIKGTGYAALGWRSKDAEASCKALPRIVDPFSHDHDHDHDHDGHSHAEPEAEGEPEGEAESEAEAEAEAEVNHRAPKSQSLIDSEAEAEAEPGKRVEKSIGISIGFVTSSVSTSSRKKRSPEEGKNGILALETNVTY